jgi:DNA-binding NarL/FixJ family response regulator
MNTSSQIRVLLADDHAVVRAGICQFMEQADDITVIAEAGHGQEAMDLITQIQPDVAVLDIQMPKASGIEVTRWVREHHREVGVLILTAYDDDPYVLAVIQAGANGYILKTASPEEIIQAVKDVHEGKSALDSEIVQKMVAQVSSGIQEQPVDKLTDRELEVLALVAKGYTNKAIGIQLGISDRTVQGHLAHIFSKLQSARRSAAVMRDLSLGLLPSVLGELWK